MSGKGGGKGSSKGPGGGQRMMHTRVKTAAKRTASSQRWLARQLNDPYVAASKRDGMRSRAAYKLREIDDKYHFLKPGQRVVDLGAAPGGWSQIAAERVKAELRNAPEPAQPLASQSDAPEGDATTPTSAPATAPASARVGQVVAIDYLGVDPLPGVEILQLDFTAPGAEDELKRRLNNGRADVVLSDMAAPTVGHARTDHLRIIGLAEQAAAFACEVLTPGGTFLCKVFQGGTERDLLDILKRSFATVRHIKPPASRADSAELYVLATGFRGEQIPND